MSNKRYGSLGKILHVIQLSSSLLQCRYAYSENLGEESDDEESQSLTGGKPEGDISLVKLEQKSGGSTGDSDEEDTEEDKRE